jgi:hypothetical protein
LSESDPVFFVPFGHTAQRTLATTAVRPEKHALQKEDPVAFEKVLTAQSVQFVLKVAPECGFFFPTAHLLQSSERVTPFAEEYRPATQFTQSFSFSKAM